MDLDSELNGTGDPLHECESSDGIQGPVTGVSGDYSLCVRDVPGEQATIDAFRDWVVDIVGNGGDASLMEWLDLLKDVDRITASFGGMEGAVWLLKNALSYQEKLFTSWEFIHLTQNDRLAAMQWYRESSRNYLSTLLKRKEIADEEIRDELLSKLKDRFDVLHGFGFGPSFFGTDDEVIIPFRNSLKWEAVAVVLNADPTSLWSILQMEKNGHDPTLIGINLFEMNNKRYYLGTGSLETPESTRNTVYDRRAEEEYFAFTRGERPPNGNAMDKADEMGARLMGISDYGLLQTQALYDHEGSCWVTPIHANESRIVHRDMGGGEHIALREVAVGGVDHLGLYYNHHEPACSTRNNRGFRCCVEIEEIPLKRHPLIR